MLLCLSQGSGCYAGAVHDYAGSSLLIQSQRCLATNAQLKAEVSADYHLA